MLHPRENRTPACSGSCGGLPSLQHFWHSTLGARCFLSDISVAPCSTSVARMYTTACVSHFCAGCTKPNVNCQQPFTPPPGSLQWTIGWMYYVSVITAESFGPSNASQIIDLSPNSNNIYTPGYMIYENGNPIRLVLFNLITEPLGFSNYNMTFANGSSRATSQMCCHSRFLCDTSLHHLSHPRATSSGQARFVWQWH